jgi:hypothetical protein
LTLLDFVEIVYRSGWLVKGYILSSFSQHHRAVKFKEFPASWNPKDSRDFCPGNLKEISQGT